MALRWAPLSVETAGEWARLVNLLAEADGTEEFYDAADLAEELQQDGFDPALDTVGAWQDDALVGYVQLWVSGNLDSDGRPTVGIGGGVDPGWARGRGLARACLAASLAAAGAAGLARATLTVDSENGTGAGRLYASMGFEPVRVIASYRKLVPFVDG